MESVIANPAGRAHRFFDIAGFHNAFDTVGITGSNAGQKICLQLEPGRPSESVCSLFEKTMRINNRLGGFSSAQTIEHFHEARLVRITHG